MGQDPPTEIGMTGNEFLERLKRYADTRGLPLVLQESRGKGSHAKLQLGNRFTWIPDRRKEIGKGLLHSMCKDLGITTRDVV
jgi:mRNA interferase HicA